MGWNHQLFVEYSKPMPILCASFFALSVGSKSLKQPNLDKTEHFCVWEDSGITTKRLQLCLFLSFNMFFSFIFMFVCFCSPMSFISLNDVTEKYVWLEGDVTKRKRVLFDRLVIQSSLPMLIRLDTMPGCFQWLQRLWQPIESSSRSSDTYG